MTCCRPGGGRVLPLGLAATTSRLVDRVRAEPSIGPLEPCDPRAYLVETDAPFGRLRQALPPIGFDGGPSDWSRPPGRPGADAPG